ncbi:MAG: nitroreductase family protein [Flavobacteriales bacterium]|nr:nitroreductase family protein [Flavobacteriales bacterium]
MKKTQDIYSKLGANEKAIIDKIRNNTLKRVFIEIIGLKLKLQWKGWLQYLIPIPILLGLLLIAFIAYLLGAKYPYYGFAILAMLLSIRVFFDIVTVKYKIRFPESKPKRRDNQTIFDLMRLRHSCRSYQIKKLTEEDFNELMGSVKKQLAEPSFSQEKIRFEYISTPIRVWPVVNATEFLVAIAPKEYNRLAVMDVGRKLQKVVIDATRMGLGTCWIGPGADHKSITSQLGKKFDPEKDNIICVCAIGYESKYIPIFINIFSKRMRKRLPVEALFFSDYKMNESIDIHHHPYNIFQRTYESCQYAPSSYNGQTTRAVVVANENTVQRIDFFAVTTSRYYAAVASGIWCANWEMGCEELEIEGKFKKLGADKIDLTMEQRQKGVPIYDMSWVLNSKN